MTCIKTGARVHFPQYGATVPADLYEVGDCIIIRSNPNAVSSAGGLEQGRATHECYLPLKDSFCRDDIGVFVVPASAIVPLQHPVTPIDPLMPIKHTPKGVQ